MKLILLFLSWFCASLHALPFHVQSEEEFSDHSENELIPYPYIYLEHLPAQKLQKSENLQHVKEQQNQTNDCGNETGVNVTRHNNLSTKKF